MYPFTPVHVRNAATRSCALSHVVGEGVRGKRRMPARAVRRDGRCGGVQAFGVTLKRRVPM